MTVLILQGIALLLQIIAVILVFRLIRITGKTTVWMFLATAFVLVAVRRVIDFVSFFSMESEASQTLQLVDSLLLLVISMCQIVGVYLISSIFLAIKHSERHVIDLNTLLRRGNRALTMLSQVNQILVRATEESHLLQDVCHAITELGGYRLAWIGVPVRDATKTICPVCAAGEEDGYLTLTQFSWANENPWGQGPEGIAIRSGQPAIIQDIRIDPTFAPWREEALKRGYASVTCLPLLAEGQRVGVLCLYAETPNAFTAEEITLLTKMAGDLAYGMQALRTREAHRQAEEALREQREFLRTVIDTVPNFIGVKDAESRFVLVNRALADAYGATPEAIIGKSDADFNPNPEEVARFQRDDREVIRTGQPKYIPEEQVTDKTGQVRWLTTHKVPLIDQDGTCSRLLLATHDITERKRAEEGLKREQAFLASAIDLLPFPILFITANREVIRQNRASLRLFSHADSHLWWGIQLKHPQTHQPIAPEDWPLLNVLRGDTLPATELLLALPDGQEVPILLQGAPIFVDHDFVATVVAVQDISALKAADDAKNQFLMVLSHELKTPLTSIIGWAQCAEGAPDLVPEALQTILRNAQEEKVMLERLLILSRILTGRLDLRPQRMDLWQAATAVIDAMRTTADAHGVSVDLSPPIGQLLVDADPTLIRRAIGEVLENAVKFTAAGGTVTVTGMWKETDAMLEIRDTGRGFAPEEQALLMHPFQQLHRLEEYGGIGIGLALVKGIVEGHGGQVHITSPGVGQGTTVALTLPLSDGDG